MGRAGRAVLLGVTIAALVGASIAAAATRPDHGLHSPPASVPDGKGRLKLGPSGKAIWATEWSACWNDSMGKLSKILHIPIRSNLTVQQAARKLATRAMFLMYETTQQTLAGKDGCYNGILWRYYHPS